MRATGHQGTHDVEAIPSQSPESRTKLSIGCHGEVDLNPGCVSTGCAPEPISICILSSIAGRYAVPCRLSSYPSLFRNGLSVIFCVLSFR